MISDAEKKAILNKIIQSKTFKSSQTYQNLLKFLVNASIKNEPLKEYDIAIEVFGKDASYNPAEDPTVRVYISNLRKKLKKYYADEGKHEKIRLIIPPGHYAVRFVHKKSSGLHSFLIGPKVLYSLIGILLVVVIVLWVKTWRGTPQKQKAGFLHSRVWKDFAQSKNPLMVVFGDDYFFLDTRNDQFGIRRYHQVNSDSELNHLKQRQAEHSNWIQTPYTFTPRLSFIPLKSLLPLLCEKKEVLFENSSKIKTADFLKYDLLFLGSFRNLYIMRQVLSDLLKNVQLGVGENRFSIETGDSMRTFVLEGYPEIKHSDYCLFRKVPGPKNNTVVLFVSFFESGMTKTADYMTNPQSLKQLERLLKQKYNTMPRYFDCLFKITGLERTGLTIHIEYLAKIDPQKLKIW